MTIDVQTALVLMLTNVFAIALALPAVMGWRGVGFAARCVQGSAVAQAAAWAAFLVARSIDDRLFSTLSMALLGASFVLVWHALHSWLGPRPGRAALWVLAVMTPLGYFALFNDYAWRVGWANFGLALQMVVVGLALVWPAPHASRRWRALVLLCFAALAVVTGWRGVLGAFYTDLYPAYRAPHPVNLTAAVFHLVAATLAAIGLLVAWHEEAERALRRLADTDELTGLMNRRAFVQRADDLLAQAKRYGERFALLMLDIDHFKRINDRHGHAAGDRALQLFAQALRLSLRRADFASRHGGEEFAALLWDADAEAAIAFDQRLRARLRAVIADAGDAVDFDFSAGLALCDGTDETTLDALLASADEALYRAKEQGRARLQHDAAPDARA
jgi:diguanylate cyclase (GGDEF)-like protein